MGGRHFEGRLRSEPDMSIHFGSLGHEERFDWNGREYMKEKGKPGHNAIDVQSNTEMVFHMRCKVEARRCEIVDIERVKVI